MLKFYIDTSIWIDLIEDRKGFYGEPLGKYADELIQKILFGNHLILISDLLLNELKKNDKYFYFENLFRAFNNNILKINTNPLLEPIAKYVGTEKNIPWQDVLHALLAKENKAYMISRDKHFKELNWITKTYNPEEILPLI